MSIKTYEAVCEKCGDKCEVPFKPNGSKPVYCSKCFVKPEGRSLFQQRKDTPQPRKHTYKSVCDRCGEQCELPFKPSGGKPVFCSNCFEKRGEGGGRVYNDELKDQLERVEDKLDKVLKLLDKNRKSVRVSGDKLKLE